MLNFLKCTDREVVSLSPCFSGTYELLTMREVKVAGCWPSYFFEVEVHKHAKKNEANIQPSSLNELGQ